MTFNINLFTPGESNAANSPAGTGRRLLPAVAGAVICPGCNGDVAEVESESGWQTCPYCQKRLQMRVWGAVQQNTNSAAALTDQATCFFHPDKAFQACCQRCGRFVCALCDLQLGAEHVCPTCFERGRAEFRTEAAKRTGGIAMYSYDSIAVTIGWGWILFWPVIVAALPAAIFLHVKYQQSAAFVFDSAFGWRFWVAYAGFLGSASFDAASFADARWTRGGTD